MAKIRLFHGFPSYADIIKQAYLNNPNLSLESPESQKEKIFEVGFGSLNVWDLGFKNDEIFDYKGVITNAVNSQFKWAAENGLEIQNLDQKKALQRIVIEQILQFQPDILFAHDANLFKDILGEIKKKLKTIRLVIGWDGVLLHDLKMFNEYDLLLSPVQETVEFYKLNNKHAFYFPFGFNKDVLNKITKNELIYNCSFIGQINPKGQHSERFEYLSELSKHVDLSLWTPSCGYNNQSLYYYLQLRKILKMEFKEASGVWYLKKNFIGNVFGIEMFQKIAQSRIVFNKHINQVGNVAANIRLFEVTGAGACLLTDYKDNLKDFFDTEREIVTYKTKSELISKIDFLLKNESNRKDIALAGQNKTLNQHSYHNRFITFKEFLYSLM